MFRLLLRAYPEHVRQRFGSGMRFAWAADLDAARARGWRAVAAFWTAAVVDTIRFGAAERLAALSLQGHFAIDWRDAWRSLMSAPLVAGFAVLSLGLGIGGGTALFSILNSLSLKPLPVREPQRLVLLDDGAWTNPIWEEIRARQTGLVDGAFAWANTRFNLSPAGATDFVRGMWVSGGMFEVLGVPAVLGRTITAADDVRGGGPAGGVAVISYQMWQRRFGGTAGVLGQTLTIERVPFTIVGVTPREFLGPDVGTAFDVAVPLGTEPLVRPGESALDGRLQWWINIMARLKPGQTAAEATALLRGVQPQIRTATMPALRTAEDRNDYLSDGLTFVSAPAGRSPWRNRYQEPLTIILVVAGLVLLIACANIANLLIARATLRRHELAVRLALGASRFRIARQLLAESALLAFTGALLGLVIAHWGSRLLIAQLATSTVTIDLDLGLDWRVLGFTSGVSALAALLAGVAPALTVGGIGANDALKEEGRGAAQYGRGRVRHASVVLQVALSLALVFGAGLFARTFVRLTTRDLGFDPRAVLIVSADVERSGVRGLERNAMFARLAAVAAAVPGVASAAASYTTPAGSSAWNDQIAVPADSPLTRRQRMTWVNVVSPHWFATLGLRLSAGRDFDDRDRPGSVRAAIVNRAFEQRFLGGASGVGRTFTTVEPVADRAPAAPYEIVGVVEDSIYRSLRSPMEPTMYVPLAQTDQLGTSIVLPIRAAAGRPEALVQSVGAALAREEPSAVLSFRALSEQIDASLTQERLVAGLAGFFGTLALLLAAIGLYGVTSCAVAARRGEIGLRMALGASAQGVVRLVLRRVAWLVSAGIVLGAAVSAWAGKYVQTLLYGLEPRDLSTFVAATLLLATAATVAAWLPARRASRIDPMQALRRC